MKGPAVLIAFVDFVFLQQLFEPVHDRQNDFELVERLSWAVPLEVGERPVQGRLHWQCHFVARVEAERVEAESAGVELVDDFVPVDAVGAAAQPSHAF